MDNQESLQIIQNDENENGKHDKNKIREDKTNLDNLDNIGYGKQNKVIGEVNSAQIDVQQGTIEEDFEYLSQKEGEESALTNENKTVDTEIKDENEINEEKKLNEGEPEMVEEEENTYVEEPPPDPAAPLNLSDSKEALKEPFTLRPDQLAEVEQLWDLFQNYTPAYTDLDNYITGKELVYMLKSLLLMTYTLEQLQELIEFCVRPLHSEEHITFEQFIKIVTIRQRDFPVEEELRSALHALDPGKTGVIDREFMKEVLLKQGHKMTPKLLDNLMKEVDISNDGTIGIEDVVGTMCIDLNKDDILMLLASLQPESKDKNEENMF